ncbi:MAG: UpxY family transcription antiterminator [Gemmatimonadota bacterium]
MSVDNSWYALYTRSRHEKRVAEALEQRGFDVYLPVIPRVSDWHDRKKTVLWPLFPGYVFVRFRPADVTRVLAIPGSVQVIGVAGRPAPIPDEEIENVRLFAACLEETGGEVPKSTPSIELGERVTVQSGPFAGVRGVVREHRGVERVLIQVGLSVIGQALKIELDTENLEAVPIESTAENRRME